MASFHLGQRVKRIRSHPEPQLSSQVPVGSLGAFGRYTGDGFALVKWDLGFEFEVLAYTIAPLTDPGAERFVASLEKLAREPLSVVERAKA